MKSEPPTARFVCSNHPQTNSMLVRGSETHQWVMRGHPIEHKKILRQIWLTWFLAASPTSLWPSGVHATKEGVMRFPWSFAQISTRPFCQTATQLFARKTRRGSWYHTHVYTSAYPLLNLNMHAPSFDRLKPWTPREYNKWVAGDCRIDGNTWFIHRIHF